MEKYGFVYRWYDSYRDMYYIGSHWGFEDDKYICSSNRMRDAYRRRPNDFKKEILISHINDRKQTLEEEHKWLQTIKEEELGKKYYNLRNCKFGHYSTDENNLLTSTEKMSIKRKQYFKNSENRERNKQSRTKAAREKFEEKSKNIQEKETRTKKRIKCEKCGLVTSPTIISRFHGEKCKGSLWNDIINDYIINNLSFHDLESKYNITRSTITRRALKEKWLNNVIIQTMAN
jgi:hypothetical protein